MFSPWNRRRRLASLAVGVAVWLTTGAVVPRHTPTAVRATTPARPVSPLEDFRLGTAAGPLGWSTAIGDFNTDGTPDLAIANRVPGRSGTPVYTIEFAVSGQASTTFAFESEQDALTVRVSDVDHDNDLDLVVTGALSREVVGVWLNDGSGGFASSDAGRFASELGQRLSLRAAGPAGDATRVAVMPGHRDSGMPLLARWAPDRSGRFLLSIRSDRFQPIWPSSSAASRAPPRTRSLILA